MRNIEIDSLIIKCKEIIENKNYKVARKFIRKIGNETLTSVQEYQLKYLNNYLLEILDEENRDEKVKNSRDIFLEEGKDALIKEDFSSALNYFKAGLYQTEDNVFNYYIGKTYYKFIWFTYDQDLIINCIYETDKYFKDYIINGYDKSEKALLYLHYINSIMQKYKDSEQCLYECDAIEKLKHLKFKINRQLNGLKRAQKGIIDSDFQIYGISSIIESNSDILDELKLIKEYYNNGYQALGNYYLKELQKEKLQTHNEKIKVQELVRNKKLYIAKAKNIVKN